ncbi:hypothetical protein NEPAR06_1325 [Nematocida parisii]|uniref:SH2 domain-containing protein n=1 Tax=Nematocida parisii (strain ERTm3) TaxID=935791 RepID=I3EEB4_NEMP3|nr:uncharacterized protein NEPG_02187 [Nematocida parisii ERTm1]EIJ87561.1 hypothetical protein NEQG_02108 [Nematocida parisii ERTm3]KAI5145009.1 hypothetical protein NEPAR07_1404 [Nematocida parisii]EIJ92788.1 hypothetical protein NEPG_02187 [Nematocida parisii ERTm1]KAI5154717.1 hypothetical protein NEPAR06_1325 [Nematocida parisii]KAI5157655.1 hypothetical protein NEPAR05_1472 [Nematocida parisii]|eukprot:XP_013060014.1 hypothetical protein NEPG_02187 [Nematocida parisii ERTm1]
MKREREEDSDDEVFERRRKVHKQEKDVKDEIEDLFEENSSEQTIEEKPAEMEGWKMTGGAAAGILLEIFGNGTDYLHVMDYYVKKNQQEEERHKEYLQPKVEVYSKIDKEEIISKVTESLMEANSSFPKQDIEMLVSNIVDDKSLVDAVAESFHFLNSEKNHTTLMEARKLVSLYREKDKILAQLPKVIDKKVKTVISCAHTLKTPEEYTRLVRYVYRLQSAECTDEDRELAANVTQKITNVSIYYTDYTAVNSDDQQVKNDLEEKKMNSEKASGEEKTKLTSEKGLLHNPWIFRAAVEIGMVISSIEIQGIENINIPASKITKTDMYLLQQLKTRGVIYRIVLNKEETVKRIVQRLEGSAPTEGELEESLLYFIEKSAEDICTGIEKELAALSEEHVKIELFNRVLSILSIKPGKENVLGVWMDKGKTRYTKVDSKGAVVSSGISMGRDGINLSDHAGIVAISGEGYRLKQYMKSKSKVYISEEMLRVIGGAKDLSSVLCHVVKNPVSSLESLLSNDGHVPSMVLMQRMLKPEVVTAVLEYAIAYKKAESEIFQSSEYGQLKKDVLEFMKSGGDPENVLIDEYATYDSIRKAIKETKVSHTGWSKPAAVAVIENKLFKEAYMHCLHRLENFFEVSGAPELSSSEEFLIFNGIPEDELLAVQTTWSLSSGITINMHGKEIEGVVTGMRQETHLRLANKVSAVLNQKVRENVVDGQRLTVRILGLDMIHYRAVVQEKRDNKTCLRAQSHWRVKNLTAKEASRVLKQRPFGSFVLRLSLTHPDSLILTLRVTDNPEKCVLVHLRIKELAGGYELGGRIFDDIDSIVDTYVPSYLKSFKRVMLHRKFTTEPVEAIKARLMHGKCEDALDKYALSISKASPGCISFVYIRNKEEATEVLLHAVEKGLYFDKKIYPKPEDFIAMFKKSLGH